MTLSLECGTLCLGQRPYIRLTAKFFIAYSSCAEVKKQENSRREMLQVKTELTATQLRLCKEHRARRAAIARNAYDPHRPRPAPPLPAKVEVRENSAIRFVPAGPGLNNIDPISRFVARTFGISCAELIGNSRVPRFVIPRQTAMYLAREITKRTFSEIGYRFNGRNQSNLENGILQTQNSMASDKLLRIKCKLCARK